MLDKRKENMKSYFFLFLFAVLFVYIASFSTSPLYPFYCQGDSAQFQTMGKGWLCGRIPYRDMFDHKGPVIFLIDMLGFSLNGKSSGITVIQAICMFVTMVYLYKISQLVCNKKWYGMITCILSFAVLTSVYGEGNFTEEYCLPFLSISTYYQHRYFIDQSDVEGEHKPIWAAIYGCTFGVCLLTRVTNAITVCCGILIISIILFYKRKYINFLKNVVGFIVGFAIIVTPFIIYFAYYGVLREFIYASIQYNIEYKARMTSWVLNAEGRDWIRFGICYFSAYSIFLVAILAFMRKKYALMFFSLLCGGMECYLYLSGGLFEQYAIIMLPQFVLLLNEIILLKKGKKISQIIQKMCAIAIVFFCLILAYKFAVRAVSMHEKYSEYNVVGYEQLLEIIPQNERDSFVAYGDNRIKGVYLLNDIMPCYKYFAIQEWHASFSDYIKEDIQKTFEEGTAKWILTSGAIDNIQDVLNSRYQLIDQMEDYGLYKLK